MTVYLKCPECNYYGMHHSSCSSFGRMIDPRPTTQARSQAATRERSEILKDMAELIECCERVENALVIEALRTIKALCVAERAQ